MSDEIKTTETTQPEVRKFSKAQAKHFNELQTAAQRAQAAVQEFVNYLAEEHALGEGEGWTLGPEGFVRAPARAKADA